MATHTGEKPCMCIQCDKFFNAKFYLDKHMKINPGERPYQCNQCEKFFSDSSNLSTHRKTHTGERSYQCKQCEEVFSAKGFLKTHMKTHIGEKPYQCNHCDKAFSQKHWLFTHMMTQSREDHINTTNVVYSIWGNTLGRNHIHATSVIGNKRTHTGGKTIPMQSLWQVFLTKYQYFNPYEETHWRDTISMQLVWQGLLS